MTSVHDSVSPGTNSTPTPDATSFSGELTVSSWARTSSGTPSVSITDYEIEPTLSWIPDGTESQSSLTAQRTGEPSTKEPSNTRVLIPVLSVVGAALFLAIFIIVARAQRRKRALTAHRRRHSWAAAHKYRWDTMPTYRDIEASEGAEAPPAYHFAPPAPVPRVKAHDRRGSVL